MSEAETVEKALKNLNKLHYSHISQRVTRAEEELASLQSLLHQDRDNIHLLSQDKHLRSQLLHLKSAEQSYYGQKLKFTFLKEADKGTRFFHALLSQKHRRNHIPAIQVPSGMYTSSVDEVHEFVRYYRSLLGSTKQTIPINEDVIHCGPCLDAASHDFLLGPVTDDLIQQTLFSIGNEKAPGPDGYSSLFFKKAWSIVGGEFCAAVKDFFASRELLKQVNHSIIALVPKSSSANLAADFRPISCCNVIYKVISKILAGRMAHVLQDLISPAQNAFLGGRNMADNVHLMQELLRHYGRKRASPRCIIKIDFRKAFDSIQWSFLQQVLLSLGFPPLFVRLIMQCVETTSFSVAVNGNLYGFFKGQCGVRQGDPLSPYLFLACMEYISRMLNQSTQHTDFNFHPKCSALGVSHLAFADDVLLLCRCDMQSVSILNQQLLAFGRMPGLVINAAKSSIYFGGVGESVKLAILRLTGFLEGSFPFRYLGVPLSPHRLLASQFSPLLQKLESSIQSWMGKLLSYVGRLELIRSVLHGMVQFWLRIFPIPGIVITKINSICRSFLWSGNSCSPHSALVSWQKVCLPKQEGGLALLDIRARNKGFLVKQLWNFHLKTDSLWIRWVAHYYLSHTTIWDVGVRSVSSPLWKSISTLKNQLVEQCGGVPATINTLQSWDTGSGTFLINAHEFFRSKGESVQWTRVVWEEWSLPRTKFILWLAALGRLRTSDRLATSPQKLFVLYAIVMTIHMPIFFSVAAGLLYYGIVLKAG